MTQRFLRGLDPAIRAILTENLPAKEITMSSIGDRQFAQHGSRRVTRPVPDDDGEDTVNRFERMLET